VAWVREEGRVRREDAHERFIGLGYSEFLPLTLFEPLTALLLKKQFEAGTPVVLATKEAEIKRTTVRSQPGQIVHKNLKKTHPQKGLMEWLKV
jgi:hypothetical protein